MPILLVRLFPALERPAARGFAFRLALAGALAMIIAHLLGLANPWWATMAVWMIGQPTRGLLLERSAAQLIGTIAGGAAALAILRLAQTFPALLLPCLCIWIAVCCGLSNAMRHQRAYGAALSGLTTAAIVALVYDTSQDPLAFALARLLDNLVGIGAAVFLVALWSPPSPGATLVDRARALVTEARELAAAQLAAGPAQPLVERHRKFLAAMAALEASAEDAAAGSIMFRRKLKPLRGLLASLLDLITVARSARERVDDMQQTKTAADLRGTDPLLDACLDDLDEIRARIEADHAAMASELPGAPLGKALPHIDSAALRLAMLRGVFASALTGGVWLASGWDAARYFLLGGCLFTILFAAADEPAGQVRSILLGGAAAAVAALAWRLFVVPMTPHDLIPLLLALPLLLGAALLQANHRTLFNGLAFNMLFAVLAQPVNLHASAAEPMIASELFLMAGIAVSYAFYRWLLPMSLTRRTEHLNQALREEIDAIADRSGQPAALTHLARLKFLLLALVARAGTNPKIADNALAALGLGHTLVRLGKLMRQLPPESQKTYTRALRIHLAPLHDASVPDSELFKAAQADLRQLSKGYILSFFRRGVEQSGSSSGS